MHGKLAGTPGSPAVHVADHLSPDQLQSLADQEVGKTRFLRLRAVILALGGKTAPEIAAALGAGRRTVQEWVARYNAEGLDGLADRPGRGRPCRLTAPQLERLRQRIDAGPLPEDGTRTLRGPEIRALLEREFGVAYSLPAVYFLLHRLGYEPLDPQPRHLKAGPAARQESKKTRTAKPD
ncbi:MAG TPA: helix-turn-helix domain-containing protein [Isosphaeraceae bacterium]